MNVGWIKLLMKYLLVLLLFVLIIPQSTLAQRLMFVDEAGNIHFVDRASQIPPKYRNQVHSGSEHNVVIRDPKTGKQIYPVLPKPQKYKKMKRQHDLEERAKEKEEKIKAKEKEKKARKQFKIRKRREKQKRKAANK